jgi:hypothetical protein
MFGDHKTLAAIAIGDDHHLVRQEVCPGSGNVTRKDYDEEHDPYGHMVNRRVADNHTGVLLIESEARHTSSHIPLVREVELIAQHILKVFLNGQSQEEACSVCFGIMITNHF